MQLKQNFLTDLPELMGFSPWDSCLGAMCLTPVAGVLIAIGGWFSYVVLVPVGIMLIWHLLHLFVLIISIPATIIIESLERISARWRGSTSVDNLTVHSGQ